MKRILFLDDDPIRHREFDRITEGCWIQHVWTANECRKALMTSEPFDLVCLDHDLDQLGPTYEETGSDVADFIRLHLPRERYPRSVIIHSWNPSGAKRMKEMIEEVQIPVTLKPFHC